jgi:hypothetical protein
MLCKNYSMLKNGKARTPVHGCVHASHIVFDVQYSESVNFSACRLRLDYLWLDCL